MKLRMEKLPEVVKGQSWLRHRLQFQAASKWAGTRSSIALPSRQGGRSATMSENLLSLKVQQSRDPEKWGRGTSTIALYTGLT